MFSKIGVIGILVILCSAVYFNTLNSGFIWDDNISILDNEYIHSIKHIPKLFTSPFFSLGSKSPRIGQSDYYRPLVSISLALDYFLYKDNPCGFHLTNLIIHLFNVLLVFFLTRFLSRNLWCAFWMSILFAIHPVNSNTVAYISSRPNLLVVMFSLLSFIFYIKNRYIAAFLSFLMALFSKESSVVLPLLFLTHDYLMRRNLKSSLIKLLPFLLLVIIYFIIRDNVLAYWKIESSCIFCRVRERILVFFAMIFDFIRIMFFPSGLHFERLISPDGIFFILKSICGAIFAIFLFGAGLFFKEKAPLYSLGISWFFLGLVPVSQIFPLVVDNKYLASEHFLYFPQIGLFIFIVLFLKERIGKSFYKILIPIIVIFSIATIYYNKVQWNNEKDFLLYNLRFEGTSRLYNNLGRKYEEEGNFKEAEKLYRKAKKVNARYLKARYNLATLLARQGKFMAAEDEYKDILNIYPFYGDVYNNLGVIKLRENKVREAIALFKKAISLSYRNVQAYCNLGLALERKRQYNSAIDYYLKGISIDPNNIDCLNQLAFIYIKNEDFDKALFYLKKALALDKNNAGIIQNIGNIYFSKKNYKKALLYYKMALKLKPLDRGIQNNIRIVNSILNGKK